MKSFLSFLGKDIINFMALARIDYDTLVNTCKCYFQILMKHQSLEVLNITPGFLIVIFTLLQV